MHMVCAIFTENITWADNVNLLGASYQEVKHRLFGMKVSQLCARAVFRGVMAVPKKVLVEPV